MEGGRYTIRYENLTPAPRVTINSRRAANLATSLFNSAIPVGGDFLGGIDVSKTGIGVQSDIRIIKTATGEVIWSKHVVGVNEQKHAG